MKKIFKGMSQPRESQDRLPTDRAVRWDPLCMLQVSTAIGS